MLLGTKAALLTGNANQKYLRTLGFRAVSFVVPKNSDSCFADCLFIPLKSRESKYSGVTPSYKCVATSKRPQQK